MVLQRVIRLFLNMRLWLWWRLWNYLRPLLCVGVDEDRIKVNKLSRFFFLSESFLDTWLFFNFAILKELEKRIESQKHQMKEEEKKLVHFEQELDRALCEKQKLQMEMEEQRAAMEEAKAREAKLKNAAKQREEELKVIQAAARGHGHRIRPYICRNVNVTNSIEHMSGRMSCLLFKYLTSTFLPPNE